MYLPYTSPAISSILKNIKLEGWTTDCRPDVDNILLCIQITKLFVQSQSVKLGFYFKKKFPNFCTSFLLFWQIRCQVQTGSYGVIRDYGGECGEFYIVVILYVIVGGGGGFDTLPFSQFVSIFLSNILSFCIKSIIRHPKKFQNAPQIWAAAETV